MNSFTDGLNSKIFDYYLSFITDPISEHPLQTPFSIASEPQLLQKFRFKFSIGSSYSASLPSSFSSKRIKHFGFDSASIWSQGSIPSFVLRLISDRSLPFKMRLDCGIFL